jgi:hypothetical protein
MSLVTKKDKTTIIFLSNSQHYSKPVQVSSKLVRHWKKFAIGILALFCLLSFTVFYLFRSRAEMMLSNKNLAQ